MSTLTVFFVGALAVFYFCRVPVTHGEMGDYDDDPPSPLKIPAAIGANDVNPPSPLPTTPGIMAPPAMKKCPTNRVKYTEKIRGLFQTKNLPDFFKNDYNPSATSSEPNVLVKDWFKMTAHRLQGVKQQPFWTSINVDKDAGTSKMVIRIIKDGFNNVDKEDVDKGTVENFHPDFVIESENSLEFAPDPNDGKFHFNPDKLEDGKQGEEEPHDFSFQDQIDRPTIVNQEIEPRREIRQNSNLGNSKTLVADELNKLRTGMANKEYRFPVSLLPANLRWLKINHPSTETQTKKSSHGADTVSRKPQIFTRNSESRTLKSLYDVSILAGICIGTIVALFVLTFVCYRVSKKVKIVAEDVCYPPYGVTGPTLETTSDPKLGQSAQMFHYQHQKQEMLSMEKVGTDPRNGSVSNPDSEEENAEGDYTVYECPGFATTGNMEVKNPMFVEESTLSTNGKCEVVLTQPKA
ncbi:unnamed protein product [Parnassius apollo]|uniref:(apollo) hypothetical protein n=1 Tax=Parnassius apollo TaxID=110799 RepID=A0A8S3XAC5_PARAO|nr:unnamed protein product [Parnassius apollo]